MTTATQPQTDMLTMVCVEGTLSQNLLAKGELDEEKYFGEFQDLAEGESIFSWPVTDMLRVRWIEGNVLATANACVLRTDISVPLTLMPFEQAAAHVNEVFQDDEHEMAKAVLHVLKEMGRKNKLGSLDSTALHLYAASGVDVPDFMATGFSTSQLHQYLVNKGSELQKAQPFTLRTDAKALFQLAAAFELMGDYIADL